MKSILFLLFSLPFSTLISAQVGINTKTPKATLDINGNLKIRTVQEANTLTNDHKILLRDNSTDGDHEIIEIDPNLLLNGSSTTYAAGKEGAWQLLALGLGNSWYKINLTGANDTMVGNPAYFLNGVYTVPVSGVYAVNYNFQFSSGVNLEVLGGKSLVLLKNNALYKNVPFDAVRVTLGPLNVVAIPVTSTTMTTLVQLNQGDTLTFAINTGGLLPINLSVLTDGEVNLEIYRVSN